MKTWRWLCLLPLFTENIQAGFTRTTASLMTAPEALSSVKPLNAAKDLKVPEASFKSSQKVAEGLKGAPSVSNSKSQEAITMRAHKDKTANPGNKATEENCPHGRITRRSLVTLRRRGCFGRVGSGLIAASNGLANAGTGLQRFDKLTAGQKLSWLRRKTINGVKHTVSVLVVKPVKGLAFLGRKTFQAAMAVIRGTGHVAAKTGAVAAKGVFISGYIVYKAGTGMLKVIGRLALHAWKYFGKGLAATGRGLQKAGKGMEAQSATRLAKKVPHPHPNAPVPPHPYVRAPPYPYAYAPPPQYAHAPPPPYAHAPPHQFAPTPPHQFTPTPPHQFAPTSPHQVPPPPYQPPK